VGGSQIEPYRSYLAGLKLKGMRADGAADPGAQDCSNRSDNLEERRNVRSEETEIDDIAVSSGLPVYDEVDSSSLVRSER